MAAAHGSRLSAQEERELVVATERGDAAACRQLVELFLPAIAKLARRFEGRGELQRIELMQEGVAALLFAARRYDAHLETPFWAYASFWVRKAMQELVAEVTRPAALSDHAVRALARINAARRAHLQAGGAEATTEEIASATGVAPTLIESLLAIDRAPRSLEQPLATDEGTTATLGETVADPRAEEEYERVLDALEIQSVRHLADDLDERERTVLAAHYGLGRRSRTLTGIGSDLGLTAERIRQIENAALEKLRRAAAEPPGAT